MSNLRNQPSVIEILKMLDENSIESATFPAHSFIEEYALSADDKDWVTFHKGESSPWIVDKLQVCDYQTTDEPVWGDWFMTINYHS